MGVEARRSLGCTGCVHVTYTNHMVLVTTTAHGWEETAMYKALMICTEAVEARVVVVVRALIA